MDKYCIYFSLILLSGCASNNFCSEGYDSHTVMCIAAIKIIENNKIQVTKMKHCAEVYFLDAQGTKLNSNTLGVSDTIGLSDEHYGASFTIQEITKELITFKVSEGWSYPVSGKCRTGGSVSVIKIRPYNRILKLRKDGRIKIITPIYDKEFYKWKPGTDKTAKFLDFQNATGFNKPVAIVELNEWVEVYRALNGQAVGKFKYAALSIDGNGYYASWETHDVKVSMHLFENRPTNQDWYLKYRGPVQSAVIYSID